MFSYNKTQVLTFLPMVVCMFLLNGCAVKKLAVKNADSLLVHQFQKRLPLYSDQKSDLSKDIDSFLNRHRPLAQELLPVVDELDVETAEKLEEQYYKLAGYYEKVAADFSKLMAKYLAPLDSKQQKDLFKKLDEENRELAKKDPEDRIEKRQDRFKMFFGSISEKQLQLLTHYREEFEKRSKRRLERRKKLHQEFRKIYRKDVSDEAKNDLFLEAFKEYEKGHGHEKNLEIAKAFLPTISKEQREHFRGRLKEAKDILKYYIDTEY